jgi:hypothetical protein
MNPFNPQPKAQVLLGCLQGIMRACAFGCGLNGCVQGIMRACAFGCGLNKVMPVLTICTGRQRICK